MCVEYMLLNVLAFSQPTLLPPLLCQLDVGACLSCDVTAQPNPAAWFGLAAKLAPSTIWKFSAPLYIATICCCTPFKFSQTMNGAFTDNYIPLSLSAHQFVKTCYFSVSCVLFSNIAKPLFPVLCCSSLLV